MKIKWINLLISIGFSFLCSYGLYLLIMNMEHKILCTTFLIQMLITSSFLTSISLDNKALKHSLNAVNIVFFVLFVILALIFSLIHSFNKQLFIILEGFSSLLYLFLTNISYQSLKDVRQKEKNVSVANKEIKN